MSQSQALISQEQLDTWKDLQDQINSLNDKLNSQICSTYEKLKRSNDLIKPRDKIVSQHIEESCKLMELTILTKISNQSYPKDELDRDVYSMMMLSQPMSKSWCFGIVGFVLQVTLALLVILDQMKYDFSEPMIKIPINTTWKVQIAQIVVIILALMTQTHVLIGIRMILMLPHDKTFTWKKMIDDDDANSSGDEQGDREWYLRIILPNTLKIIKGLLNPAAIFVTIIQSDSVVELMKNYAALYFISSLDNIIFALLDEGYLGKKFIHTTTQVKEKKIKQYKKGLRSSLIFLLGVIILIMLWTYFTIGQMDGRYAKQKYPHCPVTNTYQGLDGKNATFKSIIGDGKCQFSTGEGTNNLYCGWDGGDCVVLNDIQAERRNLIHKYEVQMADRLKTIQQLEQDIQQKRKIPTLKCVVNIPSSLGNGVCNGGTYNTEECGWDAGDCDWFNQVYPTWILDHPNCNVDYPVLLGNDICNGEAYNKEECSWDAGDCVWFNEEYPTWILDHPKCVVDQPYRLGNGVCSGGAYNTEQCGYDAGDCL